MLRRAVPRAAPRARAPRQAPPRGSRDAAPRRRRPRRVARRWRRRRRAGPPMSAPAGGGATYERAGVSIDAGDRAVELMREWVEAARRPEVLGGIGGFAGLFDASALKEYDRPLLASS